MPVPAPIPPPPPPAPPRLASFGQRLAAAVLDVLVLSVPLVLLLALLFGFVAVGAGAVFGSLDGDGATAAGGLVVGGLALLLVVLLAFLAAPLLYGVGFEGSSRGQTIGKWVVGIRVIDGWTAGPLTMSRALVRVLVRTFASGQVLALGYLWMLWDEQGRTWHDMAADSRVVLAEGPRPTFGQLLRTWSLRA